MQNHSPQAPPESLGWLIQPSPHLALAALAASDELANLLPEVDVLYGVPQSAQHHPEVDTGLHIELCLQAAERLGASPAALFAVLVHDLGKGLTPATEWPRHIDHERRGMTPVRNVCKRLGLPDYWQRLGLLVCSLHLNAHRLMEMRPETVANLLHQSGFEDDRCLLVDFIVACEADSRGRLGMHDRPYPQGEFLLRVQAALSDIPAITGDFESRLGQERHRKRLKAVSLLKSEYTPAAG